MTNRQAAERATAAMRKAYKDDEDPGELTSWEMRDMLIKAVRTEFLGKRAVNEQITEKK